MDDSNTNGGNLRGAVAIVAGLVIALVGYVTSPNTFHFSDTYPRDLYFSVFLMLLGAGLVILGIKKLIK